jgi:hypothetical protein
MTCEKSCAIFRLYIQNGYNALYVEIIAPMIVVNGSNSLNILNKIPISIQSLIMEYADSFETKTIIPLLESTEYYFDKNMKRQ